MLSTNVQKKSNKVFRAYQPLYRRLFQVSGVIKAFIREDDIKKEFTAASEGYREKTLRLSFVQALFFPLIMGPYWS